MSRKLKIIIPVLVVVALLSVGLASFAMADEAESTAPAGVESLLSRVAGILGITEDELNAAFDQAREEMREECQNSDNCTFYHRWEHRFEGRSGDDREAGNGNCPGLGDTDRLQQQICQEACLGQESGGVTRQAFSGGAWR